MSGTATLQPSTIAGMAIDSGQATGSFGNDTADIKELVLAGPDLKASVAGVFALGDTGESKLAYDVAVTNLEPLAKRFDRPLAGSAHVVGDASGPAANLTIVGKLGANRVRYSTNIDALTASATYTVQLPNFDIEQARIQADTTATFVTVAGRNLPRVTAKTKYEKSRCSSTRWRRRAPIVWARWQMLCSTRSRRAPSRALNLTVARRSGRCSRGRKRRRSTRAIRDPRKFCAAARHAARDGGRDSRHRRAAANAANDLNLRLDNVQVQDINELLLGNRSLAGVLNASAEIRGTRNDPVVQSDFAVTGGTVEGVNSTRSAVRPITGRAVDADVRLEHTPSAVLTAVAPSPFPTVPAAPPDRRVRSRGEEHAHRHRAVQPATTQLTKLAGQFSADVRVQGTSRRLD